MSGKLTIGCAETDIHPSSPLSSAGSTVNVLFASGSLAQPDDPAIDRSRGRGQRRKTIDPPKRQRVRSCNITSPFFLAAGHLDVHYVTVSRAVTTAEGHVR